MAAAAEALSRRLGAVSPALVLEVRDARVRYPPPRRPRPLEPDRRRLVVLNKGKLKHAIVSSHPGETRDICGCKSSKYICTSLLDTPGVLSPTFTDDESGSRLTLTGAIKDSLLQEYEIAQFLLTILNSREEYKEWENLNQLGDNSCYGDAMPSRSHHNKRQYASDHTKDFIVKAVREVLFGTMSSFKGDELRRLIECQFISLQEAFRVSAESSKDMRKRVAMKLLNLYWTGRLGHYTFDHVPESRC